MMNSFPIRTLCGIGAFALICLSHTPAREQAATSRIVTVANTFLSTLDPKQRQTLLFSFDDQEQRKRWSNFPISIVPRAGISLKEMNATQRSAAMALVASALSPRGFEKVQQIMEGDEVLKITDQGPPGNRGPGPGPGGPPPRNGGPPPGNGPSRNGGSPPGAGGPRPPLANGPMFGKAPTGDSSLKTITKAGSQRTS